MNAQERTMRGLAKACEEWAEALRCYSSHPRDAATERAIGRLQGIAVGLAAIADLAADPEPPA